MLDNTAPSSIITSVYSKTNAEIWWENTAKLLEYVYYFSNTKFSVLKKWFYLLVLASITCGAFFVSRNFSKSAWDMSKVFAAWTDILELTEILCRKNTNCILKQLYVHLFSNRQINNMDTQFLSVTRCFFLLFELVVVIFFSQLYKNTKTRAGFFTHRFLN